MLSTAVKNAQVRKQRPEQRKGLERAALRWVRRFDNARVIENAGSMYITDGYRLHPVPAEYAAVLELVPGVVSDTCMTMARAAVTITPGSLPEIGALVKVGADALELTPNDLQEADGIVRLSLGAETVSVSADYLADAAEDGATRLVGVGRLQPVHALNASGELVAVIMPRSR